MSPSYLLFFSSLLSLFFFPSLFFTPLTTYHSFLYLATNYLLITIPGQHTHLNNKFGGNVPFFTLFSHYQKKGRKKRKYINKMGCCQSAERVEEKQRNQEIEAQIKRDRANMKMEIKMLLLGR